MNKADLVAVIARNNGTSKAAAERAINAVLAGIKQALGDGRSITLAGFGNFDVRRRKSRNGRHPKTQERIVIRSRKTVVFRPSDNLLK